VGRGDESYFHGNTWADARGELITDEIALNPGTFRNRSTAETLSTLVHEMCHLQQHHFGKTLRNAYHNKQWAAMMEAVGLVPSDPGQEGGTRTGQKVSHYIQPGGPFDRACQALLAEGFTIPWVAFTCPSRKPEAVEIAHFTSENLRFDPV
jgi:SprT-like family